VIRAFVPEIGRRVADLDLTGVPVDPDRADVFAAGVVERWRTATAAE